MCRLGHGSDLMQGSGNKGCEKFILRCLFGFIAALTEARQESLLSGSFDLPLSWYFVWPSCLICNTPFLTYWKKKSQAQPCFSAVI